MKKNKPDQRFLDAGIYEKIVKGDSIFYQRDFARLKPIAEEFERLVEYYSNIERLKKIHGLSRLTQDLTPNERRSYWSTRLRQANEYLTEHSQLLSKDVTESILNDLSDSDLLECLNNKISLESCFKEYGIYDKYIQFKSEQGLVKYLNGRLKEVVKKEDDNTTRAEAIAIILAIKNDKLSKTLYGLQNEIIKIAWEFFGRKNGKQVSNHFRNLMPSNIKAIENDFPKDFGIAERLYKEHFSHLKKS